MLGRAWFRISLALLDNEAAAAATTTTTAAATFKLEKEK